MVDAWDDIPDWDDWTTDPADGDEGEEEAKTREKRRRRGLAEFNKRRLAFALSFPVLRACWSMPGKMAAADIAPGVRKYLDLLNTGASPLLLKYHEEFGLPLEVQDDGILSLIQLVEDAGAESASRWKRRRFALPPPARSVSYLAHAHVYLSPHGDSVELEIDRRYLRANLMVMAQGCFTRWAMRGSAPPDMNGYPVDIENVFDYSGVGITPWVEGVPMRILRRFFDNFTSKRITQGRTKRTFYGRFIEIWRAIWKRQLQW